MEKLIALNSNIFYVQNTRLEFVKLDAESILAIDEKECFCYGLHATLKHVFALLSSAKTFRELVGIIMLQYEINSDKCQKELKSILEKLLNFQLINTSISPINTNSVVTEDAKFISPRLPWTANDDVTTIYFKKKILENHNCTKGITNKLIAVEAEGIHFSMINVVVVWNLLTMFERYQYWNKVITHLEGAAAAGNKLRETFVLSNTKPYYFSPIITHCETYKELRWESNFLGKGLCTIEHYFKLDDLGLAGSHFIQGIRFKGILGPFIKLFWRTKIQRALKQMNTRFYSEVSIMNET